LKILLDTHVALWALADRSRLSPAARALLEDPENECWVSSASAWELAIKVRLGKHRLAFPLAELEERDLLPYGRLLDDAPLRRQMGATAQAHIREAHELDRNYGMVEEKLKRIIKPF